MVLVSPESLGATLYFSLHFVSFIQCLSISPFRHANLAIHWLSWLAFRIIDTRLHDNSLLNLLFLENDVLESLMSTWHKFTSSERGKPLLKNVSISSDCKQACRHFLMIYGEGPGHCGLSHPWASVPRFYKKSGWKSHVEQANKQHSSLDPVSTPAFRFRSCLSPCPDFLH